MVSPSKKVMFKRVGPPATASATVVRKPKSARSNTKAIQQSAVDEVRYPLISPPEVATDKITLAVLCSALTSEEQEVIVQKLREQESKGNLTRGTTKSKGFKYSYWKHYDDGSTLEIRVAPTRPEHAKQFMNFTLNPAHTTESHVRSLSNLFQKLFPARSTEIIRGLCLYRVDLCVDLPIDVNSLIIRKGRNVVESKFFVLTDKDGRMQTIY